MPYQAEISRGNPTAFLFLIDQSGSMDDPFGKGRKKSEQTADVLNRTLANLIIRCTKSEGVRDYFDVGVIGYSSRGINNGFCGELANAIMHPISQIEAAPLKIEERIKKEDDGAGGILEKKIKFPVWFEPEAHGGTPMTEALLKASEEMAAWCDAHPDSYPPTILHITDGESTDGDPSEVGAAMKEIHTNNGNLLLFNLHLSDANVQPIMFPDSVDNLPNAYAKMLFLMSSVLPPHLIEFAREKRFVVTPESRGFIFNGDAVSIVDFFDVGTRAAQMR